MNQNPNEKEPAPGNPQKRDEERRQEFPGREDTAIPQTAEAPGEPEGSGDNLEREPNQRPHDLDFHQSEDFTGKGIKGEDEERQRREQAA